MTEDWSISRLNEETSLDRRTIKKILADTAPHDVDGKTEFYKLADFIKALVEYHKPKGDGSESALIRERTRLTAADADIREVERARVRNEVMETETVIRVWENICVAIRRTIETSPLPIQQKDSIFNDLRSLKIQDYLEQQGFTEGTYSEDTEPVSATTES
jgi:phage terminase Nu1 subunit (DNA packaging protein)